MEYIQEYAEINDTFNRLFNRDNIFIVDIAHHILTGWATHSLTCATFMMMQYANIQYNNNFFDKYVLLSNSCLPFNWFVNKLICVYQKLVDFSH